VSALLPTFGFLVGFKKPVELSEYHGLDDNIEE
jgi:hypothetical protein